MSTTHVKRHPGLALAVIACAQLMVILDATIVNVALPTIHSALHFSASGLEWVVTAYALTFGGLLLFGGRTGDLFGKRRMFMIGIAVFAGSSLLCGLATDQAWLIVTRGLQGVGGAIASPTALSLVAINFSEGTERNRAMGVYSAMSAVGGTIGLLLGGVFTTHVSWRWIFFVNVPIGAVGLFMAPRVLHESDRTTGRLDMPGAVTATAGMLSLVYGLTNAATHSWGAPGTLVPLLLAVVLLVGFVLVETRTDSPLMPLSIFKSRNRSGAYALMLCLGVAVFGMFFFLTQYLQNVKGYSAVRTGLGFLPMSIGIMVAAMTTARFVGRVGIRPPLVTGPLFALGGMIWLTQLTPGSSYLAVIGPLVILALGMGQCFVPLTLAAVGGVVPGEAGLASALLNTGQQVGGALGLAVLATLAISSARSYAHAHAHTLAGRALINAATVHGYTTAFTVAAGIVGFALLISVVVLRVPGHTPDPLPAGSEALAGTG